jgi:hypothetical protein
MPLPTTSMSVCPRADLSGPLSGVLTPDLASRSGRGTAPLRATVCNDIRGTAMNRYVLAAAAILASIFLARPVTVDAQ